MPTPSNPEKLRTVRCFASHFDFCLSVAPYGASVNPPGLPFGVFSDSDPVFTAFTLSTESLALTPRQLLSQNRMTCVVLKRKKKCSEFVWIVFLAVTQAPVYASVSVVLMYITSLSEWFGCIIHKNMESFPVSISRTSHLPKKFYAVDPHPCSAEGWTCPSPFPLHLVTVKPHIFQTHLALFFVVEVKQLLKHFIAI